jgi:hypothetical protein
MNESYSPRDIYVARLSFAHESAQRHKQHHVTTGNFRLLLFLVALVLAWASLWNHFFSTLWLAVPAFVFFGLGFIDDAILRKLRAAERRVSYYERGLARIDGTWQSFGSTGERFASTSHAYSHDLDLFTTGGLFQLLSVARTGPGESLLADWLRTSASPSEITRRHAAIAELRTLIDFRESAATIGDHAITSAQSAPLWHWSEESNFQSIRRLRIVAAVLTVLIAAAGLWYAYSALSYLESVAARPPHVPFLTLLCVAAANLAFGLWLRKRVSASIAAFEEIRPGLGILRDLLVLIEQTDFSSPELSALQRNLRGDASPSRQIARLNYFADMLDSRENLLLRVCGPPLLWTTQVCLAIESWRSRHGVLARRWVDTVSEFEALNSLATYSWEHPGDCFPQVDAEGDGFVASDMAHPLLTDCVPNSVSITAARPLLIVSGSNMSGKSTLLRTIGINAVLALAGSAVRAPSLRMHPVSLATSIRVADSLQEGASHFSAEIERIRQIIETARDFPPTLFLIDEILQGTNSGDRRIGSEAILTQLLALGALGVITTHDLALTHIGRNSQGRVVNAHFRDQIADGKMVFDYVLKPGVVQGSNALDIMRLYGLLQ